MLDLARALPAYWISRNLRSGWPRPLPINLTFSLTYQCNSRCATCNVWKLSTTPDGKGQEEELSVDEWDQVLGSMGRAPYWVTVSGGEPLLRKNAVEIIYLACDHCRPAILNVPTNGLLPDRIVRSVDDVTKAFPDIAVVVNLSLDGWGEDHDRIRGVPGNFERATETFQRLRSLQRSNLTLGVHTVISRFNAEAVPTLYSHVQEELAPDSYIMEIAEERVELDTTGAEIEPPAGGYKRAIEEVMAMQDRRATAGLGRIAWAFRRRYYRLVEDWLRVRRQMIPCYAGWASGQIAPNGDVWFCCVRGESVGNLREAGYDFPQVWWNDQANRLREQVRSGQCHCPLANAAYTNLLLHPPSLAGVVWDLASRNVRR